MEDKPESLEIPQQPQHPKAEQARDHTENVANAIKKADESTDDRVVEAAAKKDGLRGALASRMDVMSQKLDSLSKRRIVPRSGVLHYPDMQAKALHDMVVRPSAYLGSKTAGMLRDRLRSSANVAAKK